MYRAGQYLVGKHDFGAFKAEGSNLVGTVRTVYACLLYTSGLIIIFDKKCCNVNAAAVQALPACIAYTCSPYYKYYLNDEPEVKG